MAKVFKDYEHFVPAVKLRPDMPGANEHVLIRSIDELKEAVVGEHKFVSLDFETSGLNAEEDFIVGFSFAFSSNKGYYVPVNHAVGISLGKETLDVLYQQVIKADRVFLYNARFDMRFFEFAGYDLSKMKYFDVMKGIWFADTNVKMPSLKWAERHFLGWDPATFEQTLGDAPNFYHLDPEVAYEYACVDAEGTFALVPTAVKFWKEAKLSGQLDNDILYPLMKWENEGIRIDVDYLNKKIEELTPKLHDLEHEIYSQVGYQFALKSGKQLGDALQSVGINTGEYTKGGQMKTDINTLEALAKRLGEGKESKLLRSIIRYSKLIKLISSFFESLRDEALRMGGRCRFAYIDCNVPTGRLASGSDKKNMFFAHLNIQAIAKPHPKMWYVHDGATISDEDLRPGEVRVLDWVFSQDRKSDKWEEGFEQSENIRSAFLPEEGHYWVSIDFNAQELRIPAALSGEPAWREAFIHGTDPHKSCYSEDTEYLTPNGWKLAVDIGINDLIAQYNHGKIEYVPAGERFEGESGELVRFKGLYNDLLVTKNHRMFMGYHRSGNEGDLKPKFITAEECLRRKAVRIRNSGIYEGSYLHSDVVVPDVRVGNRVYRDGFVIGIREYTELLGFIIGDGCIAHDGSNKITMAQSAKWFKQLKWLESLVSRVPQIGFNRNESVKDAVIFEVCNKELWTIMESDVYRGGSIKRIPLWMFEIPIEYRELFLEAFIRADGSLDKRPGRKSRVIYAERLELIEDFQRLCVGLGYRTYIDFHHKELRYHKNDKGTYRMSLTKVITRVSSEEINLEEYSGKTYCFSVPSGVLVVRRNGKVSICGNTAIAIWGEENYDKDKRKKAKVCNFGLQYGGNKYTLQEKLGIQDLDECEKIANDWKNGLPTLFAWQNALVRRAKKTGVVYTYFGRPRRVKFYLNSADGKTRAFGVRTVKNSVVQGCGADLTKIGMLKLWKKLLNPELNTGCRFLNTIHDEVNISIPKDPAVFHKYLAIARACMRIKVPGWPFPMETGIEIGDAQGRTWAFNVDDEGNCIPKWEDVPQDEAPPEPEVESTESEDEDEFNIFMS